MTRGIAAVAVVVLAITAVVAPSVAGTVTFTVMGVGGFSCGKYLEARRAGGTDERSYRDWLGGFLSAMSLSYVSQGAGPNALGAFDIDGVMAWLDKYCREHPLDAVATAASELIPELVKREIGRTRPTPAR